MVSWEPVAAVARRARRGLAATTVVALACALAACGSSSSSSDGARTQLSWVLGGAPRSLDTPRGVDVSSLTVAGLALEPLVTLDAGGEAQPALARRWTTPSPRTVEFRLRDDVRFWDGRPLTAADVEYSLRRIVDPRSQTGGFFTSVAGVRATGARGVRIDLRHPDAGLLAKLAIYGLVVQRDYAERKGDALGSPNGLTMGTGPYRVTRFSPAAGIEIERNDRYWGDRPAYRTIRFEIIPDAETRRLALSSGDVDGTFDVPLTDARRWSQTNGMGVFRTPMIAVSYLSMDVSAAPFDDVHVRRAVAHAVDREGLLQAVTSDYAQPAGSFFPAAQLDSVLGADGARELVASLPRYDFDLDQARAELARSRHPDGFSVSLPFAAGAPQWRQIAQSVAANLRQIGITVTPEQMPGDKWIAQLFAHEDLQMQGTDSRQSTPDPNEIASVTLSQAAARPGGFNLANFTTPALERELATLAGGDEAARPEALRAIARTVATEVPYLPLWYPEQPAALHEGLELTVDDNPWLQFNGAWLRALRPAS